ncbi:MAG TPA: dicarboxylate/amino acid:cation symporter [Gemmatimonadaceae bacterium]
MPASARFLPKSPAARATIGLVLGLIVGVAIAAPTSPLIKGFATAMDAVGTIWVNAIRMTVIPLVVSLLIATIAREKDLGDVGRMGGRAVVIFTLLLSAIAVIGVIGGPPILSMINFDSAATASLRGASTTNVSSVQLPTFSSWLVSLVPANPVKAAADGAMLPLIIFAVLFAAGLSRAPGDLRTAGTEFFRAIADAMLVVVGWVLAVAPIGVFALSVTLALKLGAGIAGAVGLYLLAHCGLLVVAGLLLYVIVALFGRVSVRSFAKAVFPAQIVAFSTRSSLAALPAMIDGAERVLGLPPRVASFALPFGVSLLRANTGTSWVVSAIFIGKLFGIDLTLAQILVLAATSVAMSFSVPGIPSGGLFIIAPAFMTAGLPIEGVGILIALDAIPDIFKTSVNVTGHMTATVLLARSEEGMELVPDTVESPVLAAQRVAQAAALKD